MSYTTEQVEAALHQLYHATQGYAEANRYLTLFHASPEAWSIAWQLLDTNKAHEVQYFGANTLHFKISRHWNEIPEDQYGALRTKLLETMLQYSKGPKFILTKIIVAVASFAIHVIPNFWPSAVSDLIVTFQPSVVGNVPPLVLEDILLELLTVIPEELQSSEQSSRSASRAGLDSASNVVFGLLESRADMGHRALRCYSSWAQLSLDPEPHLRLLPRLMQAVTDPELCCAASEALTNVVSHPDAHQFPNFILRVVDNLAQLKEFLNKMAASKEMELCQAVYGLLIEVGENHSRLLVDTLLTKPQHKDNVLTILNLILQCSGTPGHFPVDESCSRQALGFWYALQDDVSAAEGPRAEALLLLLHPVWQALVDTLLRKAQLPLDDSHWAEEEKDALRCYRQDIGDSLMYCYNVLHESMLAGLVAHLQVSADAVRNDATRWPQLEACLLAFQSVAASVDVQEDRYVGAVLAGALPALPAHPKVTPSALACAGAYGEWLAQHPQTLQALLPMLLASLHTSEVAPAATLALKDVARDCRDTLGPMAHQILTAASEALAGSVLGERERIRMMGVVGHTLSSVEKGQVGPWLQALVGPQIRILQDTVAQDPTSGTLSHVLLRLNMLTMLFSTLDTQGEDEECGQRDMLPVEMVIQELGPTLVSLSEKYATDERVVETLCECLRKASSGLGPEHAWDTLALLVSLYSRNPQAPILEACQQLFLLAGPQDTRSTEALSVLCSTTLATAAASQNDFREHTVILEAFFQMLAHVVRKLTAVLNTNKIDLSTLFICAAATIMLPEKPTVKSAAQFLGEFILRSREYPEMLNVVNNHGGLLTEQIIRVIGSGESPRSVVEPMADLLLILNKKYFDNLCRWLSALVQRPDFPSSRATASDKEHYVRLMIKERANKRRMREIVAEFSLLCRGLIGTEYAAQTFKGF
ncbi:importin-13-like [Ornithodoros turicata]|uniref:importin-13-like n=1 Tax=Ornithodoros turicata TaxID=34597 RepID=UPI0031390C19